MDFFFHFSDTTQKAITCSVEYVVLWICLYLFAESTAANDLQETLSSLLFVFPENIAVYTLYIVFEAPEEFRSQSFINN